MSLNTKNQFFLFFNFYIKSLIILAIAANSFSETQEFDQSTESSANQNALVSKKLLDSTDVDSTDSITDTITTNKKNVISNKFSDSLQSIDTSSGSDTITDGFYFGAGVGWTIGSFDIAQLWKGALPDSLSKFNLAEYSFKVERTDSNKLEYMDTSKIRYRIKEQPGQYNIMFPVSLSITKLTNRNKINLLLSLAYINKTSKSVIIGDIDSLSESVNIKQHLSVYSFSLTGNYSTLIPTHYFTINEIDKCYFTFGIGLTPQIVQQRNDAEYEGRNNRFHEILNTATDAMKNKIAFGIGITGRAGITTLRYLNKKRALEFNFFYTLSRCDYYYSNGNRLSKSWINSYVKDNEKHLSFLSNRLELSVSILRMK